MNVLSQTIKHHFTPVQLSNDAIQMTIINDKDSNDRTTDMTTITQITMTTLMTMTTVLTITTITITTVITMTTNE